MSDQKLMTLKEAAESAPVSERTLRRYIHDHQLPAVRRGGRLYVTKEDVDAATAPVPVNPSDEYLTAWAAKIAGTAPQFRPEQREIIINAFVNALGGGRQ